MRTARLTVGVQDDCGDLPQLDEAEKEVVYQQLVRAHVHICTARPADSGTPPSGVCRKLRRPTGSRGGCVRRCTGTAGN